VGELVLQLLAASLTLHWPRRVETAFPATEGLRMAWAALSEQLTSGRSTCPNLFPLPVEPPSKTPPPPTNGIPGKLARKSRQHFAY